MKRINALLLALCIALAALPGAARAEEDAASGTVVTEVNPIEGAFGNADTKALSELKVAADITLTGDVTITQKGVYHISGSAENATITVSDTAKSGNITLILEDLCVFNESAPALVVESADKVILWLVGDCVMTATALATEDDAVISARDDLTVTGTGTLTVTSPQTGIACSDDFRQTGATLNVEANGAGLDVNDSVRIGGGALNIVSGKDGIHLSNSALDSWFYLEAGAVSVTSAQDGIDVSANGEDEFTGFITLLGGTLEVTAGDGVSHTWNDTTSRKGLRCQGDIYIGQTVLSVVSTDDAIHSGASVYVTGGELTLSSEDDGIHADAILSISGGKVTVRQSYEGLEAYQIDLSGGEVSVYASDDGLNAAGGSDTSSQETDPWAHWSAQTNSTGTLNISGGTIYVNAGGDGVDANGSIYVTGGLLIVEGPTDNGNGAIDRGDGMDCVASITGGTVLAIGSTGMAVNFDSGTQCAALVSLSGGEGDTITADDGSGFTFTASKAFECAVYSSPSLEQGGTYTLSTGTDSAVMDFTDGLYWNDVGGFGGFGGFGGGHGGFGGPGGGY